MKKGDRFENYHRFFKRRLFVSQASSLLKLTLGLDVIDLKFIEDAKKPEDGENYLIDVERAHLKVGKEYYLLFEFLSDSDGIRHDDLIQFLGADYTFRLGPLAGSSHLTMDRSGTSNRKTALAMARLVHIYQLLQMPLESGYRLALEEAFEKKTVIYDGEEINLWGGLDDDIRDTWIERWKWVKDNPDGPDQGAQFMGEDPFLNKFYPDWYINRFLPQMQDYRAYLTRNPSCKYPEFWDWFVRIYTRQNRYP